MLCPLGSLHIALDLERCSTTDCGLPPTRLLSMPILSRIIAACGLGCCGRNCCMNPIDCLQCRAYLCDELVVLGAADELRTINLHGLLLDMRRVVDDIHGRDASAVRGNDVEHASRRVEERVALAVGRHPTTELQGALVAVDLQRPSDWVPVLLPSVGKLHLLRWNR